MYNGLGFKVVPALIAPVKLLKQLVAMATHGELLMRATRVGVVCTSVKFDDPMPSCPEAFEPHVYN